MELISGKMTSKGQITIPKELREKFDLHEGDQIKFLIQDDEVKIKPVMLIPTLNGRKLTVYTVRNLPKTLTERKEELSICSPYGYMIFT